MGLYPSESDAYEPTPEDSGYVKIDSIFSVEHNECVKQSFMDLMEAIYITGDVDQMEINLRYLCDELGFVIPNSAPLVEKISCD